MTKLLLHSCCGPCSIAVLEKLKNDGVEVTTCFFNPNIHPYKEFVRRRDAWLHLMQLTETPYILEDSYLLEDWLFAVAAQPQGRCSYCYEARLKKTAAKAVEMGFDSFSTTLLISPYQNREQLLTIGSAVAKELGIAFYEEDFHPLFRQGQAKAREMQLYRQQYCGCIYSEKERYLEKH